MPDDVLLGSAAVPGRNRHAGKDPFRRHPKTERLTITDCIADPTRVSFTFGPSVRVPGGANVMSACSIVAGGHPSRFMPQAVNIFGGGCPGEENERLIRRDKSLARASFFD